MTPKPGNDLISGMKARVLCPVPGDGLRVGLVASGV